MGRRECAGDDAVKPAVIIFPYNDPDPAVRRLHVRWMHGACGWAIAHGYAPVCSVLHMATTNDAPFDADGPVRTRVLDYSTTMAQMVGAAGGDCITPSWCGMTTGMEVDLHTWMGSLGGFFAREIRVTLADIEPYMPRDLVGQVQEAIDQISEPCPWWSCGDRERCNSCSVQIIENHTGITQKQQERHDAYEAKKAGEVES